jgi:hypothetical protein
LTRAAPCFPDALRDMLYRHKAGMGNAATPDAKVSFPSAFLATDTTSPWQHPQPAGNKPANIPASKPSRIYAYHSSFVSFHKNPAPAQLISRSNSQEKVGTAIAVLNHFALHDNVSYLSTCHRS